MTSRFFLSLTAFSLCVNYCAIADTAIAEEEFLEQAFEEEIVNVYTEEAEEESVAHEENTPQKHRRVAFPPSSAIATEEKTDKQPLPKKMKPHFAGVRRSLEPKTKTKDPNKKPRKIKNEWFSSKTQPKNEKKEVAEIEHESAELPPDRPYFIRTSSPISAPLVAKNSSKGEQAMPLPIPTEGEGYAYPQTGFQAPNGHVYLTGEWLYWRTRQEGMEFATSKQIEFDFQSGFRAGLGAHLPSFDGWEIYVNYTYFNPQHSHSAHGALYPLFLFQGSGISGNAVAEAHGHWRVKFQSLDVEFGKAYYLTKTLAFNPFFGLKGAWIEQHAHFQYQGGYIPVGQTFRTHFENDFKGAGPLLGTEMNWQLGAGFSLFGDIAAALIIGHFDNEQQQHQLGDQEVVHLDSDFNLVSPVLQLVGGVAWDRNFHKDKCHFGLSAGFETQYWWSQNQTEQFTDDIRPTYMRQKGDLAFYGLTLRGRLDF